MTCPARIVASVVAASLAGVAAPERWASLPPDDRTHAEALRARLREGRSREEAARAIVAARAALACPSTPAVDARRGALAYARWLRGLDRVERALVARAFDGDTAAAVAAALPQAAALDPSHRSTAARVVAAGAVALGRLPSARELAALLALARAAADVRDPAIVRWERSLRVAGRQRALVELAEALG